MARVVETGERLGQIRLLRGTFECATNRHRRECFALSPPTTRCVAFLP